MSSCFTAHPRPLAVDFDRDDASTHLGKGTFGQVFRARCTLTNAPVAVKVMSKSISRVPAPHLLVMFTSEVNALDALNGSPHVVSLVGYEETPSEMHIGTELALGGTVFDAFLASCRARAVIPTPVIKAVVWQTLTALRRVHAMGLVHRDVKPENLLLRDAMPTARLDEASPTNIHVLLSDFGSATHAPVKDRDAAGTTMYLSPESVAFLREAAASTLHSASSSSGPSKSYGTPHDVWAVGVILLELLLRKRPFAAKPGQGDSKTIITKFAQNTTFRTALLDQIECPDARDLAQGLLCPDPSARLTCDEALAHPWIKSAIPDPSTTSTTASSDVVIISVDRSVKSNVRSAGALCHALCPRSPTTE